MSNKLAMGEAILAGLIPVLSDIPVHRGVTADNAFYFKLSNPQMLTDALQSLIKNYDENKIDDCRAHVKSLTSRSGYFEKLRLIYNS